MIKFDEMPLPIVKSDCFDSSELIQRPCEARRGILAARKEHERGVAIECHAALYNAGRHSYKMVIALQFARSLMRFSHAAVGNRFPVGAAVTHGWRRCQWPRGKHQ